MSPRIERLRAALEEPLLVTNPTNILYLFGFKSSNAALLVDQDRARLFTDFRYSEAARAVEGVEFHETKRLGHSLVHLFRRIVDAPLVFQRIRNVFLDGQ